MCDGRFQSLEEREKRHSCHKEQLAREQRFLRRRLAQLSGAARRARCSPGEACAPASPHAAHQHSARADSFSSVESSSGVSTADRSPSSVSESGECLLLLPPLSAVCSHSAASHQAASLRAAIYKVLVKFSSKLKAIQCPKLNVL